MPSSAGVEVDTSGQDVSRTCLFSYDPDIYFNPDATAVIVEQPPMFFKSQKKKRASGKRKDDSTRQQSPHRTSGPQLPFLARFLNGDSELLSQ